MKKVLIVGGGASGLFLASLLKDNDVMIDIVEIRERVGKKILETGNGRCNFLNSNIAKEKYNHEQFINELIKDIPYDLVLKHFKNLGLAFYQDEEGRYYPYSNAASSVLDVLRLSYKGKGRELTNCYVKNISYDKKIKVSLSNGEVNEYDYLIISIGSKVNNKSFTSLPLNFKTKDYKPSLAPLKINVTSLKGIRAKVKMSLLDGNASIYSEKGEVIFRDNGISGICILNASFYLNKHKLTKPLIKLDLLPNLSEDELENILSKRSLDDFYVGLINKQLANFIIKNNKITKFNPQKIARLIKNLDFEVLGIIDNPQVSSGGISIKEVDQNFKATNYPNTYIVGEALDIDGACGGFNLYYAFASSYKAYLKIKEEL